MHLEFFWGETQIWGVLSEMRRGAFITYPLPSGEGSAQLDPVARVTLYPGPFLTLPAVLNPPVSSTRSLESWTRP